MTEYKFIQNKQLDINLYQAYLVDAALSNQYTNGGVAVSLLEKRAHDMLKISSNKAVIAVNNGTSALHVIVSAIKTANKLHKLVTQAFTFASAIQGSADKARVVDFTSKLDMDLSDIKTDEIVLVTNCFGHVQNLEYILENTKDNILIFDNAATPYTFWNGINTCNLGTASFVSLHHTKPLGFGEGGLVIINKEYESIVRNLINFGKQKDGSYSRDGNNFKMSELSAAGILQWWEQFNIEDLSKQYRYNYYKVLANYAKEIMQILPNYSDVDNFFPNCLPALTYKHLEVADGRKYYRPLASRTNSYFVYNNIMCLPIAE
jgi:dTDP-4-amino-4,6-dideoxygalactose transaminase